MREFLTLGSCVLALACSVQQTTDFSGDASTSSDAHTSSGGFPGKENCENTVDDDGDGAVDCADDECFTYTCASAVPEGWTGPVALFMGAETPPECPASGGFTDLAVDGGLLDTPPAYTCPTCTCDPTGVTCAPSVQTFADPDCVGLLLNQGGSGCVDFNGSDTQESFKLFTNPPGGACTPSAEVPIIPPPTLTTKARICRRPIGAKSGAGCFADSCIPKPQAPFQLCVYRNDPAPCPTGYETTQTITTTYQDQRSCTACTCGTECTASAVGYDFCGASPPLGSATANDQCANLSAGQNSLGMVMASAPVCVPGVSQPQGAIVEMQVTLCCRAQSP